jgi:hypothetical protein
MIGTASKGIGVLFLVLGVLGLLAVVTLLLFFASLFQDISSLAGMGRLNDTINALAGVLAAVLASGLHPYLRRAWPRVSLLLLAGVWAGALAISYGSWLIISGRSGVELSSYYYFLGNGLIGLWVWSLSRLARQQGTLPGSLARRGLWAGGLMMVGLLGLAGVLAGWDGNDSSPLVMVSGLSYFGTGILYPIWCLLAGRWMLSRSVQTPVITDG